MTQHLTHSGHVCLGDGSVLRLDREMGRWCASWYRPDLTLMAYAWGPEWQMKATADAWIDAFDRSTASPSGGDRPPSVPSHPGGGHQTLGGVA